MDALIEFLANAEGIFDFASMIKLFGFMIGVDGIVMMIYAIVRGFNGR